MNKCVQSLCNITSWGDGDNIREFEPRSPAMKYWSPVWGIAYILGSIIGSRCFGNFKVIFYKRKVPEPTETGAPGRLSR